jgi:flagellar motor protein MotB
MKPTVLFSLLLSAALPAQVAAPDRPVPPVPEQADAAAAAKDDAKAAKAGSKAATKEAKEALEDAQAAKEKAAKAIVQADQATQKVEAAEAAASKAGPAKAGAANEAVEEAKAAKNAAADEAVDAKKKAASAEANAKQAADEAAAATRASEQALSDEAAAAKAAADAPQPLEPKTPRGRPGAAVKPDTALEGAALGGEVDAVIPAEPVPTEPGVVVGPDFQDRPLTPDGRLEVRPRPTRLEELEPAVPIDPIELQARERQGREERRRLQLQPIDPIIVRRQFFIEPRIIEIPVLPPPRRGPEFIEVQEDVFIQRVYDPQRNVVVVVEEKQARELPYVAVPVLFVRGSADLLDAESRRSIEQMAGVIREVIDKEPQARFDVEGHASTDGAAPFNMALSVERARRIYDELTLLYRLPAAVLTAHGYGENHPMYPEGTENQRMLDRRVLIVRTR